MADAQPRQDDTCGKREKGTRPLTTVRAKQEVANGKAGTELSK